MTSTLETLALESEDAGFGASWKEAKRLHDAWNKKYSPKFWGETVASEWPKELSADQKETLFELFGAEFTLRIDWVTRISEKIIQPIQIAFPNLEFLTAGVVLHDYKTAGQRTFDLYGTYQPDPQFMSYPLAWNALRPDERCIGIIAHRVVKTKEVTFQPHFVPLEDCCLEVVSSWLQAGDILRQTDICSGVASGCTTGFGRKCPYLFTPECDRISHLGEE